MLLFDGGVGDEVSVEFLDAGLLDVGFDSLLLLFEAVISEKYISFFLIDIIPMKTYFFNFWRTYRIH